jgi:hypothetical protein
VAGADRTTSKGDIDFTKLPESELAAIARGREAFALYGWKTAEG